VEQFATRHKERLSIQMSTSSLVSLILALNYLNHLTIMFEVRRTVPDVQVDISVIEAQSRAVSL